MARRAPTLFRISQLLRLAGTVVVVVLVIFLATAAYSAAHLRPNISGQSATTALEPNGTAVVTESVNLTNQGYYPISPLSIALQVRNYSGALLGEGGSASLTVPAGATTSLPFSIWLGLFGSARQLETHDATLPVSVWINATYASIFVIHLNGTFNYSWGAPLYGFNATPGSPTLQSNGTVLVPITVSFSDHAPFAVAGTLAITVRSSGGVECSSSSVPLNVPPGASLNQQYSFYASSGCDPSGGTLNVDYSGGGLALALPPEPIP